MKIKHLDFVKTPQGHIALVKEISMTQKMRTYSIAYIEKNIGEMTAWWSEKDLTKVSSLNYLLAYNLAHPFGNGRKVVEDEL